MSDFEKFAEALKSRTDLMDKLSDAEKLEIYALFKQASVGDINIPEPGYTFYKGKDNYKWDAWNAKKGLSQDDARQAYVDRLKEIGVTI